MNHSVQQYFKSFRVKATLWYTFLAEVITLSIISFLFWMFGKFLNSRAYAISGGKSLGEFQTYLLSGSLEASQEFLFNVRVFALVLLAGSCVLIIVSLLLYSLSQSLLWCRLLGQQWSRKRFWRWNVVTLVLIFLSLPFFLAFLLLRVLISLLPLGELFHATISRGLSFLFVFIFLVIIILTYFSFAEKYRVWDSISNSVHLLKTKWSSLWKNLLGMLGTLIVLTIILYFVQKYFLVFRLEWLRTGLSLIIFFLFISWMRLYIVTILKENHALHEIAPQN